MTPYTLKPGLQHRFNDCLARPIHNTLTISDGTSQKTFRAGDYVLLWVSPDGSFSFELMSKKDFAALFAASKKASPVAEKVRNAIDPFSQHRPTPKPKSPFAPSQPTPAGEPEFADCGLEI